MLMVKKFAEGMAEQIRSYLPREYRDVECTVTEQQKNNGVIKTGLLLKMPDRNIAPVVYIDSFYEQICRGESIGKVTREIADACRQGLEMKELLVNLNFLDYNSVKEYLSVQIINTKANQRMLSKVPHWQMADLSVICRIEFQSPDGTGNGSVTVTNEMMAIWGIRREEVYQKALANAEKKSSPVLKGINDVMCEILDLPFKTENLLKTGHIVDLSKEVMFVLTNETKMDGASVLAYPSLQSQLEPLFPNGCYLIPSSLHEIIIVPKGTGVTPKELGELVRDVNRDKVSKEETLSDRVYEFDKDGQLCQVPESMKKEKEMER